MKHAITEDLLVKKVKDNFRHDIIETTVYKGEVTHLVDIKSLRAVCNFLKTDPDLRMNFLCDVLGVDYFRETPRFEVVYHFYSIQRKHRIRVKVRVAEN
ncbi:MAG: NADH-quinone oxidoreductase subunit C, partial [Deltaproteobacteria bacterium]|nr:NADH-quinone oxidoreductase subunit C [Deltaproteobacteria bacterium]